VRRYSKTPANSALNFAISDYLRLLQEVFSPRDGIDENCRLNRLRVTEATLLIRLGSKRRIRFKFLWDPILLARRDALPLWLLSRTASKRMRLKT